MAKLPKMNSSYTDKQITPAQWCAERMCERKAKQEGQTLPRLFWNTAEWRDEFRKLVTSASKLIKQYGLDVLFSTMKREDIKWCYSFTAPSFAKAIVMESKIKKGKETLPTPVLVEIGPVVSTASVPKNNMRKL